MRKYYNKFNVSNRLLSLNKWPDCLSPKSKMYKAHNLVSGITDGYSGGIINDAGNMTFLTHPSNSIILMLFYCCSCHAGVIFFKRKTFVLK